MLLIRILLSCFLATLSVVDGGYLQSPRCLSGNSLSRAVSIERDGPQMFVGKLGQDITVYVLNSGIRVTSPELDGRATFGANFVDNNVCQVQLQHLEIRADCCGRIMTSLATAQRLHAPLSAIILVPPRAWTW